MLALLPADNLRTMANVYHVRRSANSKRQIISDLILKSQQTTVATFFGKSSSVGVRAMVKKYVFYWDFLFIIIFTLLFT